MENKVSIEDQNRVIAEFMQLPVLVPGEKPVYINPVLACQTDRLSYHDSWGWLMQVVEKISEHHYPEYYGNSKKTDDDGPYDDCAYPRTFGMRDKEGNYMVRFNAFALIEAPTFMEAVHKAVYEWIADYNENKTPKP